MALQSLILPIVSLFRSLGIQQATTALRGLTGQFKSLSGTIGTAAGAFGAFSALQTATQFTVQSVEATQRFERNLLALSQVFEELSPRMQLFAKEVENYGLSQSQAAQASVFLGSVLKQYGFSVNESAAQTERLVTLAQDLATTYGYDVQEALLAITALFRGEYDPIEKFGVAMKQNEVNARLAAEGLGDLEGAELANAQATARLTMLFERAGDSVGAFTRASDTLYGSQQRLTAILGNLQVAAGAPLQQPLANINNLFADIAQDAGTDIVEIFEALGQSVDVFAPLIEAVTKTLVELLSPLQQVVNILTGLMAPIINLVLIPAFNMLNSVLGAFNSLIDGVSAQLALAELRFRQFFASLEGTPLQGVIDGFQWFIDNGAGIGAVFEWLGSEFDKSAANARALAGEFLEIESGARAASTALRRAAGDKRALEGAALAGKELEAAIKAMGIAADETTGKTSSLTQVFNEIEEAARKSEAEQAMKEIGLSVGFIEKALTSPDWEGIFKAISRYAYLAAIDISKLSSVAAAAGISNERAALEEYLAGAFEVSGAAGGRITDYVGDFFGKIDDEVEKQTAARKLQGMGASQGLIEAILGSQGWEKIVGSIVSGGTKQLQNLQRQFNQTADGIAEINALQEEARKALEETEKAAEAAREALQRQQEEYAALVERINEFKTAIGSIAIDSVLATFETEVGRFERSVIQSFDNIQSSLKGALDNKLIFQEAYNQLVAYANQEQTALQDMARQRDELARKGDFVENLLRQYRNAFTGALQLTSVLNSLEEKTREVTITEVESGIGKVGDSVKDLRYELTRTYTETITETINKTGELTSHFRDIAQRAKTFADNLKTLKQMGLDPMLFNQLVEAGVEAGGETAQALIDGGSDTINEINGLFKEISDAGVSVAEYVADDFYTIGEDFGSQLLEGIRSQQSQFEQTAKTLAKTFQDNFNVKVGEATQQVQDQAKRDVLTTELDVLNAEMERINSRLKEQDAILTGGTAGPGARAWAVKKTESYNDQLATVQKEIARISKELGNTKVTPLARGGIALSSTLALIGEKGPEAVVPLDKLKNMGRGGNVYNVYVTADTRVGGAKAGEAIVQQLRQYEDKNGSISSVLKVG